MKMIFTGVKSFIALHFDNLNNFRKCFHFLFSFFIILLIHTLFSQRLYAAIPVQIPFDSPSYKVSLRVGLEGQIPVSFNTIAKSGKKTYISEFSDDGQSEILIEMFAKKSQVKNRDGLFLDLTFTKRIRGVKKASGHTQIFAPENEEFEMKQGRGRHLPGNLSLAVMAHRL
jgi:hypothetical protein